MSTTNNAEHAKPSEAQEAAWRYAFAYADRYAITEDAVAYANHYQRLVTGTEPCSLSGEGPLRDVVVWPAHSDVFPEWKRANSSPADYTGKCDWCGAIVPIGEVTIGDTCWVCAACVADHQRKAGWHARRAGLRR